MAHAYTPGLKVIPKTIVHKTRRLPLKGNVIVKANELVTEDMAKRVVEAGTKGLEGVIIKPFDTLLVDLATSLEINTIIRGLRAVSDFEFELQMGYANSSINSKIETVYLMPTLENAFVSSTIVREIIKFEGKFQHLVPKEILKCI